LILLFWTGLLSNTDIGCVLLARQFRLPAFLNGGLQSWIEAPAGLLGGAGAFEQMCAKLVDEAGFDVGNLNHLFDVYM
jgi:hypothetical protein